MGQGGSVCKIWDRLVQLFYRDDETFQRFQLYIYIYVHIHIDNILKGESANRPFMRLSIFEYFLNGLNSEYFRKDVLSIYLN